MKCFINDILGVDLMREIFTQLTLVDNMLATYPFILPRRTRAPLLLTFVCATWRKVALDTPTLWSRLSIDIEDILEPGKKRDLIQLWLERAWGTPVSLHILDIRRSRAAKLDKDDWLGFILSNVPYLKFLSAGPTVTDALLSGLISKPKGTARHLGGIATFYHLEDSDQKKPFEGMIPTLLPNLKQLDLSSPIYAGWIDVRTDQLTHLSCSLRFFQALGAITGKRELQFPKLIELFLHHDSYDTSEERAFRSSYKAILPELRFFKIFDSQTELPIVRGALDACECPQLEVLHIENIFIGATRISPTVDKGGDFSFLTTFLHNAPRLRIAILRHQAFWTTAFFKHPHVALLPIVQVSFPVGTARYRTVDDARKSFGNMWRDECLEVVFLVGSEGSTYTTSIAFVGWSRVDHPLGTPLRKSWPRAFWDQEPYAQYVSKIRSSRLVPC
ncbi:hypothetical protein D9611_008251 [Ephemerocybe angulata]|uniref:F-box domain-containing protein n=1 Tax=Ephemerocybe angulata TaxID=980116 RepID=A0A8H5BIA4_9AGAR|nr:hypothetical protein D9611_008251 [Tulosesus angulatus]